MLVTDRELRYLSKPAAAIECSECVRLMIEREGEGENGRMTNRRCKIVNSFHAFSIPVSLSAGLRAQVHEGLP